MKRQILFLIAILFVGSTAQAGPIVGCACYCTDLAGFECHVKAMMNQTGPDQWTCSGDCDSLCGYVGLGTLQESATILPLSPPPECPGAWQPPPPPMRNLPPPAPAPN